MNMSAINRFLGVAIATTLLSAPLNAAQQEGDGSRFGRASKPRAEELVEYSKLRNQHVGMSEAAYQGQMDIHRAHVIMLAEQNILKRGEASEILQGLKTVKAMAEKDGNVTDYMVTEASLINAVGPVGGKMHTARSRNDLGSSTNRIYYRDQINRMIEVLVLYEKALLQKAAEHKDTVMSHYTHRKQAQPITLGHYLLAHVEAAGKSVQRFEDLYRRVNLSTLGAGATAGTGWPINRQRTAELLGFDGLVVNTVEGVGSWDYVAELAAALSIHMSNLSRLATELQIWSSDEFATIDLDESFAGTSSIMPQKKNPSALEGVRNNASQSLGMLVAVISSANGAEYQNTGARVGLTPESFDMLYGNTKIMAGVVRTMVPQRERMLTLATEGFSTMAEVADTIVRHSDLSFRDAHEIVAHVVMTAIGQGKTANQITEKMIQDAAVKETGKRLNVSSKDLMKALDPTDNVLKRNHVGGPAPAAVQQAIEQLSAEVSAQETRLGQRHAHLKSAADSLDRAEQAMIATR
jgi:argininosuccinate lyase